MTGSPLGISWQRLSEARIYDLAQPLRRGIPVSPNHPDFELALIRRHGDMVRPDGGSAANEIIVMGGHVGTHLDALCHVSHHGDLHGGVPAETVTTHAGFSELGVETVAPFLTRGVLLDVARVHGLSVLPAAYEITDRDLEEAASQAQLEVGPGDAVLVRSGWAAHFEDPPRFLGQVEGAPGLGERAARWLVEREVALTGGETIAHEVIRPGVGHRTLPVHRILLVEAGIHIVEVMDLSSPASEEVYEFLFVLAPLRLVGATGSPVRPLAVVDG